MPSKVRSLRAIVVGLSWSLVVLALGVWVSSHAGPAGLVLLLPWVTPGFLLALWGVKAFG